MKGMGFACDKSKELTALGTNITMVHGNVGLKSSLDIGKIIASIFYTLLLT
jgi:hypothetical protein